MEQNSDRRKVIISGVFLILILGAAIYVISKRQGSLNISPGGVNVVPVVSATANQGKLVDKFPASFILMKDAVITDSKEQSMTSPGGQAVVVLSAHFTTHTPFRGAYDIYQKGLVQKKYNIDKTQVNGDEAIIFSHPDFKVNSGESVAVTIKAIDAVSSSIGIFINQSVK